MLKKIRKRLKLRNGFVMIETVIVISILALGLISIYSSYVIILKNINTSNTNNAIDTYIAYQLYPYFISTSNGITTPYYVEVYKDYNTNTYYKRDCGINASNVGGCGLATSLDRNTSNMYLTIGLDKAYFFDKKISKIIESQA